MKATPSLVADAGSIFTLRLFQHLSNYKNILMKFRSQFTI